MFGERFQRFARGEAGRDEVLDHQDPRARGDRKSPSQPEAAVFALDEDRLCATTHR